VTPLEKAAFENFALVLADAPGLRAWTREEKEDLVRIIRAKANGMKCSTCILRSGMGGCERRC